MEGGYYLLTYKADGISMQKVFCEPSEEVDIKELKPVEKPLFNLELNS